jgi:hypothetical protein
VQQNKSTTTTTPNNNNETQPPMVPQEHEQTAWNRTSNSKSRIQRNQTKQQTTETESTARTM